MHSGSAGCLTCEHRQSIEIHIYCHQALHSSIAPRQSSVASSIRKRKRIGFRQGSRADVLACSLGARTGDSQNAPHNQKVLPSTSPSGMNRARHDNYMLLLSLLSPSVRRRACIQNRPLSFGLVISSVTNESAASSPRNTKSLHRTVGSLPHERYCPARHLIASSPARRSAGRHQSSLASVDDKPMKAQMVGL